MLTEYRLCRAMWSEHNIKNKTDDYKGDEHGEEPKAGAEGSAVGQGRAVSNKAES